MKMPKVKEKREIEAAGAGAGAGEQARQGAGAGALASKYNVNVRRQTFINQYIISMIFTNTQKIHLFLFIFPTESL